jgi:hypothetical protein
MNCQALCIFLSQVKSDKLRAYQNTHRKVEGRRQNILEPHIQWQKIRNITEGGEAKPVCWNSS